MPRHCFKRLMHRSTVCCAACTSRGQKPVVCRPGCLGAAGGPAGRPGPESPPGCRACAGARGSRVTNRLCRPGRRLAWCGAVRVGAEHAGVSSPRGRRARHGLPGAEVEGHGRQRPSAARWIFVVSPPRDRPMAWSTSSPAGLLFAGPGRVLVGTRNRGVHRNSPVEVLVGVGLGHQRGKHPLPGTVDGPHPQPVVDAPTSCYTSPAG